MHLYLANGLFWVSVACCLVAQLFIVRSVLGARHVPNPAAHLPRARGSVELLWSIAPAVALVVLLVFTWRAIREHDAARAPSSVTSR